MRKFYFVPPEERIFARDEEKWMWNVSFYRPTKWLWCSFGGWFSVPFMHEIRRRNVTGEVCSCNGKSERERSKSLETHHRRGISSKSAHFGRIVNTNIMSISSKEGYFLRWIPTSMDPFSVPLTPLDVRFSTSTEWDYTQLLLAFQRRWIPKHLKNWIQSLLPSMVGFILDCQHLHHNMIKLTKC